MTRPQRLSATFVSKVKDPGRYGDGRGGHGLALVVQSSDSGNVTRCWVQRVRIFGRATNIGLGRFPVVSLSQARTKALANLQMTLNGVDPRVKPSTALTFEEAVEPTLDIARPNWKPGSKTEITLRGILRRNLPKSFLRFPIDKIDCSDILGILRGLAIEKPETARKLRVFMSQVFKWSIAEGHRTDDPTDARIDRGLPKRAEGKHFRALEYWDVPAAVATIRQSKAWIMTILAFEFLVLTAGRSGEVRDARWSEIDEINYNWEVPAERMKSRKAHTVPLSPVAYAVLKEAKRAGNGSDLIFPSIKGKVMSDATITKLLRNHGINATAHGFRRSFRNWCLEDGQDRQLAELSLAHSLGDKTEQAYLTSDGLERRWELMKKWGKYVYNPNNEDRSPNTRTEEALLDAA